MKRKKSRPIKSKWSPPDREPKYQIGQRVKLNTHSTAVGINSLGTIHGIIWKDDGTYKGYWYDVNFDGFLSTHGISEILLDKI